MPISKCLLCIDDNYEVGGSFYTRRDECKFDKDEYVSFFYLCKKHSTNRGLKYAGKLYNQYSRNIIKISEKKADKMVRHNNLVELRGDARKFLINELPWITSEEDLLKIVSEEYRNLLIEEIIE